MLEDVAPHVGTPYGKARIGRVRPRPGEVDAQAIDVRRAGQLAGRSAESYQGVPPVKRAPWEWYLPLYFWGGGIAAGSWLAAAAEDLMGEGDPVVIRAGRYLSVGSLLGGTVLLIADLGRSERFLNMLRIVRPRSAMSIGSWVLVGFGAFAGAGAVLQAAMDRLPGRVREASPLSRKEVRQILHLAGTPVALFLGGYTGALLAATATPAWAARRSLLAPLFLFSSTAAGLAAVSIVVEATGGATARATRRLARAEALALAGELALVAAGRRAIAGLPSVRTAPTATKAARWLEIGAGIALPLALAIGEGWRVRRARPGRPRRTRERPRLLRLLSAGLALAGSLALRYSITYEGYRSADTPEDTWRFAGLDGRPSAAHPRPAAPAGMRQPQRQPDGPRRTSARGDAP